MFSCCRCSTWRTACGALLLTLAIGSWNVLPGQSADSPKTITARQVEVDRLITQLGDSQYANRIRAQEKLKELGLSAFDALHRAQDHDDIEIAMRARYIVRSMQVQWAFPDDPPAVRKLLSGYGDRSNDERKNRMENLSKLPENQGLVALCRLVRYEASEPLSKRAALLIMQQGAPEKPAKRSEIAGKLREQTGTSRRTAANWMRAYAQTLVDPEAAVATWDKLTRAEEVTLSQFPKESSRDITRDVLRWQAAMLRELNRHAEGIAVIRRTLDLLEGTQQQLLDMIDWLVEREAWTVIDEIVDRFPVEFNKYADLVYRIAESQAKQGRQEQAEKTAARALAINPDDSRTHIESAIWLKRRGLILWCVKEYRQVIKISPAESRQHIYSCFLLSEILHDQDRDLDAANVLQGVVEAMKQPQVIKVIKDTFQREPGGIRSRMYYFFAQHHARNKEQQKHREFLEKGIQEDPRDADVLIAMYRLPKADAAWKEKTQQTINTAVKHFQGEVKRYQTEVRQGDNPKEIERVERLLASANNQLAWLAANTNGDLDEALRCSQRSLELRPDSAGYLDTLAHCYYAKGDYQNAVKNQLEAVGKEPHSAQMQRQLKLFQESLRKQ
ncbi:MAG: tetratricopeptide repeat protein [Pirellulaceae bacterium]